MATPTEQNTVQTVQPLEVAAPQAGQHLELASQHDRNIQFLFDITEATFSRTGNDLVVEINGGDVAIQGFFETGDAAELPTLTLEDGVIISAADFLQAYAPDMDISTAAGPTASAPTSGMGSYADEAGNLLGGVDKLSSLGSLQAEWATAVAEPLSSNPSSVLAARNTGLSAPSTPGNIPEDIIDTPASPVALPDPVISARAVLFKTAAASGDTAYFELMDSAGKNVNPSSTAWTLEDSNGYFDISKSSVNPDGTISIPLSEAGTQALADAKGANIYDYITVTVGDNRYTMQMVVTTKGDYADTTEDALLRNTFAPEELGDRILREWQTEDDGSGKGSRILGGSDDYVIFQSHREGNGGVYSASPVFGGTLDTGAGNDTVRVLSDAQSGMTHFSRINTGAGDDIVIVEGNISEGRIDLGTGNNQINVHGTITYGQESQPFGTNNNWDMIIARDTAEELAGNNRIVVDGDVAGKSWASGWHRVGIHTGSGDDTLTITGNTSIVNISMGEGSNTVDLQGGLSNNSAVTSGAGNDVFTVSKDQAGNAFSGNGWGNSIIDMGDGDNSMVVTGNINKGTIKSGSGDDTVTITGDTNNSSLIDLGGGNNLLHFNGANYSNITTGSGQDTVNLTSMAYGKMSTGEGDDLVNIQNATGGTIDLGSGNNILNIASGSASSITAGPGDDTVTIGGAISAAINLGNGNNQLTAAGKLSSGSITTGSGNDSITVGALVNGTINAGLGSNDIHITGGIEFQGAGNRDYIVAGFGNADSQGSNNNIVIDGNVTGKSWASGDARAGIKTGDGDDTLTIKGTADLVGINLSNGNNVINFEQGLTGHSTVNTGSGDDAIHITGNLAGGGWGNAILNMGDGNNFFEVTGNVNKGTLSAGSGDDTFIIHGNLGTSSLDLGDGNNSLAIDGYLNNNITTGSGHDQLDVHAMQSGTIMAGDGNDTVHIDLFTGGTINAGAGNDYVVVDSLSGTAAKNIAGGEGFDVFVYNDTAAHKLELAEDGHVRINGLDNFSKASITGFEGLGGGSGNDVVFGNSSNNLIYGGAGNDTLTGGGGDDTFTWKLGDQGEAGKPAIDTIMDFGNGNDKLDLRELLPHEAQENLSDYLQISNSGQGNITISINTEGHASQGMFDQVIVLENTSMSNDDLLQRIILST